jgi:thioredoxin reductase (NADPH)
MIRPVILAVDDDPQVLRAISRDLNAQYGREYRVVRAGSAAEALDALRALDLQGEPVALIVSDQRMPHLDGVHFLAQTREMYPDARRALLTAYADTDAAIAAINTSQVDYYFTKPWEPPSERLYPVIDDLLETWRADYHPGYEGAVRIIGNRWAPEVHELKEFLSRNRVPYQFLDVEGTGDDGDEARRLARPASEGAPAPALPLVLAPAGARLEAPTVAELAAGIGLRTQAQEPFYQVAIAGGGPAGLAAAVYAASEGLTTVLIEREAPGGQAGTSSLIENYLGFPSGLSGGDLARRALDQARRFNVEILAPQEILAVRVDGPYKHVTLRGGGQVAVHVLMLTMGLSWQMLPATGAEALSGRGIYYGATTTEVFNCRNEDVYVVGAGNSAGQAALHLARSGARSVTMLVRGHQLSEKMSQYLVDRIEGHGNVAALENVHVRYRTEVLACHGGSRLEGLTLVNRDTGATDDVKTGYLFVFIGAVPRTDWLDGVVARDANGFILTGSDLEGVAFPQPWPLARRPFMLEASVPGIFAAGDVRHDSVKRVASAVGEGSVAVHFIHRHLAAL